MRFVTCDSCHSRTFDGFERIGIAFDGIAAIEPPSGAGLVTVTKHLTYDRPYMAELVECHMSCVCGIDKQRGLWYNVRMPAKKKLPSVVDFTNELDTPIEPPNRGRAQGGRTSSANKKERSRIRDMRENKFDKPMKREGAGGVFSKHDIQKLLVKLSKGGDEYLEVLHAFIMGEETGITPSQRLEALKLALGYLYGKPVGQENQSITVDVTTRLAPDLSDEELEALLTEVDNEPKDTL